VKLNRVWMRRCKRCDNIYESWAKRGRFCPDCKIKGYQRGAKRANETKKK